MATRTPQNIEMQRGFKTGEGRDFITRTVAIGSIPDGAQNPLWSAKELAGTWIFCKWIGACPCCAVMQLTSGKWAPDDGTQISQTQVEDVVEVKACMCPGFMVNGEYGREGNTK